MGPSKDKIQALELKMEKLGIKKKDIEEKFIKSSGRGGQKVNKSATAVFLRHHPTGLTAKCGKARSQNLNRFIALRNLLEKIEAKTGGTPGVSKKADKIKKQKARRKRKNAKKQTIDE